MDESQCCFDDSTLSFDSRYDFDDVLKVFQASPLLWRAPDDSLQPIYPQYHIQKTQEELRYALASTKLKIRLDFEIGTKERVEHFLRKSHRGVKALHISCPTQDECLLLESPDAIASVLEADRIVSILKSRVDEMGLKFVFVTSRPLAQAFLDSGVPCVLLCQRLEDHDMAEFSNFLYTVLAEGKPIQEAVDTAKELVKSRVTDDNMITLLCNNSEYEIVQQPLFQQNSLTTPLPPSIVQKNIPKHGDIHVPPEIFVGRQQLMFQVLDALNNKNTGNNSRPCRRLIYIHGPSGSGKTALIDAVCHYMMDRRSLWLDRKSVV